ncbi:ATP-binding protein [Candidatus Woesearchaeota archaeon]|nr:ATP-binding protein [Candidatus Woesearchaeota archaeon]
MVLGHIIGKSGTNEFYFLVEDTAKKFMYVKAKHKEDYIVLAQIVDVQKEKEETKAKCNIMGYRDKFGILRNLRTPLEPGAEIEYAEDEIVRNILGLKESKRGAYVGVLEDRENIKVYLDLNKIITKHLAVLAKSGSGKSYLVSILLEEILERKIPIVVIDPHGEYSSLKYPSKDGEMLKKFGLEPKGYFKQIQEFSPDVEKNPEAKLLKLNTKGMTGSELMHMLPAKLSGSQMGLLYGALSNINRVNDFDQLMLSLQSEENNAKWTLINVIDYLKSLNIFSESDGTTPNDLVKVGKCSILNLRGVPQEVQEIIVYKLVNDLFSARKRGEIPPFFLVVEEAHNYSPERNFGEAKSSPILRQVIAEGRKFGLGVALVTQRPARLDKTVLSQCSTQFILKITNPNDLKSISNSVEGITSETEKEIVNLHVGTAMLVGISDMPLFIDVRPRMTLHGGQSIDVVGTFVDADIEYEELPKQLISEDVEVKKRQWNDTGKEVVSMIRPKVTKEEIKGLVNRKIESLKAIMIPCYMFTCIKNNKEFNLLINLYNGQIINDLERGVGVDFFLDFDKLSKEEIKVLATCIEMNKKFTAADVFAKTGIQFSKALSLLTSLVSKMFLVQEGNGFVFHNNLNTLLRLNEFVCYEKNEFIPFSFDDKLEIKYNLEDVLKILKNFVEVKSHKECNLVKYDVVYTR